MHDDLTAQDIAMMQKELDHRKLELMPELIEEVKRTRAFGDLSENFEYKAAKQAQNRKRSQQQPYPLSGTHDQVGACDRG